MTVETSTHNTSTKPRGRPSIDFTNMNSLINNPTELNFEKPTLIYDILSRDESTVNVTLTDEQKKDKYLLVIATTLTQLTSKGDKVWMYTITMKCTPLITTLQQKNSHKQFRSSSGRLPPIGLEAYIARYIPLSCIYLSSHVLKCWYGFADFCNMHHATEKFSWQHSFTWTGWQRDVDSYSTLWTFTALISRRKYHPHSSPIHISML